MLDVQHFLGGDDEEHLVPDLAGLAMGHIRLTTPISGLDEWLADVIPLFLHLHRASGRSRGAL